MLIGSKEIKNSSGKQRALAGRKNIFYSDRKVTRRKPPNRVRENIITLITLISRFILSVINV